MFIISLALIFIFSTRSNGEHRDGRKNEKSQKPAQTTKAAQKFDPALNKNLLEAAKTGKLSAVKTAVTHGAFINTKDETTSYTPLHYAVRSWRKDLVEYLLTVSGVDVNTKGRNMVDPKSHKSLGGTPLCLLISTYNITKDKECAFAIAKLLVDRMVVNNIEYLKNKHYKAYRIKSLACDFGRDIT